MANTPKPFPSLSNIPNMGQELFHRVLGTKVTYAGAMRAQDKVEVLVNDGYKDIWVDLEDYTIWRDK